MYVCVYKIRIAYTQTQRCVVSDNCEGTKLCWLNVYTILTSMFMLYHRYWALFKNITNYIINICGGHSCMCVWTRVWSCVLACGCACICMCACVCVSVCVCVCVLLSRVIISNFQMQMNNKDKLIYINFYQPSPQVAEHLVHIPCTHS